jgi:sulfite reductase (NADPH) flavoprotein alpha-component
MTSPSAPGEATLRHAAKQHFEGQHLGNVRLTSDGSLKATHHHVISLSGAPVVYRPGDAVGMRPTNDPALVDRVIEHLGATGAELVPGPAGTELPLHRALAEHYALSTPSRRLIELMVERGATTLAPLLEPHATAQFKHFVSGKEAHDILDVLTSHPEAVLAPDEFVGTLRTILPRLYSIASSQRAHPDEVHVLVVSVSYHLRGRRRSGVASTWLNERWPIGATAEMYLQNQQKHFALPADPSTALIMVGPGTGVAPFRAFLEERRATGATGRHWLFFGEQHRASDFLFQSELDTFVNEGLLRLTTAFSRDQEQKLYVQHRMREHAKDLWAWLEGGAAFYVCGDKDHMAADVDRALHQIVAEEGGMPTDAAKAFVDAMRRDGRYRRDVY